MLFRSLIKPFAIPANWPRIIGYDLPHQYGTGTTGAFAAVWIAFNPLTGDRENPETMDKHIYRAAKVFGGSRADCVAACLGPGRHGDQIPGAFPHDGGIKQQVSEDNAVAQKQREIFEDMGLNVIPESSAFLTDDDKKTADPILAVDLIHGEMIEKKLFIHDPKEGAPTGDLTGEMDSFHMKGRKIPPGQNNHCCDSLNKGFMMARFAEPLQDAGFSNEDEAAAYSRESFDPMTEISRWGQN